ncbi:ice-binding protein [Flavobacterium sp. K5-23]|uniref:ice-binding protein n=1 Tax=Flavobacterium sp. K5-23 TaxID=2746225 RepID=UPI00200D64AC|nr:ice-binding protein [Flavobacterium sp. K5-23]UQD56682.1 DUF3494 domain-containing protein [Flavobacterium sp. K5-23]
MKILKTIPVLAVLFVGLMSSCSNDAEESSEPIVANSIYETSAVTSQKSSTDKSASILKNSQSLEPVNLGIAGDFVILSKTGITDVYKSDVTGDVGASPITGAAILLKCDEVTGTIYSVDAAGPDCKVTNATRLTVAVGDMQSAYTNAAGRINPDFLNLGAGSIGGRTLTPGLYTWTSSLNIPTDITISGSPTDVWIFQVAGNLNMSSAVRITLAGGAQAKNIFWQTSGAVTLGTTSHFEGNILSQTGINLKTGASINGRMLAQTAVTLQMNTVVMPK